MMYSKELDVFIMTDPDNPDFLITSDNVSYRQDEAVLLARETPTDLAIIHNVKKIFDGEFCDIDKHLEDNWVKEPECIKALWKSRLDGPPKHTPKTKRTKPIESIQEKLL